jgi:hypothetical protein
MAGLEDCTQLLDMKVMGALLNPLYQSHYQMIEAGLLTKNSTGMRKKNCLTGSLGTMKPSGTLQIRLLRELVGISGTGALTTSLMVSLHHKNRQSKSMMFI